MEDLVSDARLTSELYHRYIQTHLIVFFENIYGGK